MTTEAFAELACEPEPPVEELALGLAAEFRRFDAAAVRGRLDALAGEVSASAEGGAHALIAVLGGTHGFRGDHRDYDHPDNSMLPTVLERRVGLPITLSVLYVAVASRAGIPLRGVGLPGHFVTGLLEGADPLLIDPFEGGKLVPTDGLPPALLRPWGPHETALRMLNNLVGAFTKRGAIGEAIHAADLRLLLPVEPDDLARLTHEARALRARLN